MRLSPKKGQEKTGFPVTAAILPFTGPIWKYPADVDQAHLFRVSAEEIMRVDSIRDLAISCGWEDRELYQNQSIHPIPYGAYGLVCYVRGKEIGAVRADGIELFFPPPHDKFKPLVFHRWLPHHWRM